MESLNINNLFAYLSLSTVIAWSAEVFVSLWQYVIDNLNRGTHFACEISRDMACYVGNGIRPASACHLGNDYIERHGLSPP